MGSSVGSPVLFGVCREGFPEELTCWFIRLVGNKVCELFELSKGILDLRKGKAFFPRVTYLSGSDGAEPQRSPFVEIITVVTSVVVAAFTVAGIVWEGAG